MTLSMADFGKSGVVLDKKIMMLVKTSAELSALAYYEDPYDSKNPLAAEDFGRKAIESFIDEPDQALFVKKDGYCYLSFRGTARTITDWRQNIRLGREAICADDGVCCDVRQGYHDAYTAQYTMAAEEAVRNCAATCENRDECVVLTGHSQGAAVATVAAVRLADLNPLIITFGQPSTMYSGCSKVNSERLYRFINSVAKKNGINYDPIPFAPGFGATAVGYEIILSSDDDTGVAYIGLDAQDEFEPWDIPAFSAHNLIGSKKFPGYYDRIKKLMEENKYPIRDTGYVPGSLCSQGSECTSGLCEKETSDAKFQCVGTNCKKDGDCGNTNRCDSGHCLPKLGTCMDCDEDSDCMFDTCNLNKCSGSNGLMDNECSCKSSSDCHSGRCEGMTSSICYAKDSIGAWCNEVTDCLSGFCNWRFTCAEGGSSWFFASSAVIGSFPSVQEETGPGIISVLLGSAALIVTGFIAKKRFGNLPQEYEEISTEM